MRFVWELLAVFVSGLVIFVIIGGTVACLVMGVIGLASAVFFGMGLFCAVSFVFFHAAHSRLRANNITGPALLAVASASVSR